MCEIAHVLGQDPVELTDLRVLNAQQSLFGAQQRYAANRGAVLSNYVAVFRSLGGGWQTVEPRRYIDDATRQQMEQRTNWGDLLENPPPEEEESNE